MLERNPVAQVRGEQRLADRRNPTDGIWFEIEFVNTDDGIGCGLALFIFYRHRCTERNAVRPRGPGDRQCGPMPELVRVRPRARCSPLLR